MLKKAHDEIDRVLGPGQLPSFEDQDSLPYITAIVKETLRWRDVVPLGESRLLIVYVSFCLSIYCLGGPHRISVEDEYRGYRIPAGSIVFPNAWYVASVLNLVSYRDFHNLQTGLCCTMN